MAERTMAEGGDGGGGRWRRGALLGRGAEADARSGGTQAETGAAGGGVFVAGGGGRHLPDAKRVDSQGVHAHGQAGETAVRHLALRDELLGQREVRLCLPTSHRLGEAPPALFAREGHEIFWERPLIVAALGREGGRGGAGPNDALVGSDRWKGKRRSVDQ